MLAQREYQMSSCSESSKLLAPIGKFELFERCLRETLELNCVTDMRPSSIVNHRRLLGRDGKNGSI